jgi:hypothetical protein
MAKPGLFMFQQFSGTENFDIDWSALPEPLNTVFVRFRIMPEVIRSEIIVEGFKK